MRKKNAYRELDIFDQPINGITPKDYCEILQTSYAKLFWQSAVLDRESALYIVNNLFSVFNYRFANIIEPQSFTSWENSVLLKQVTNFPKFGVTNYYFTYRDPEVLCAFWTTILKSELGAEIGDGGVFYLHGSEDNENVSGFLLRLNASLAYDFFYIPELSGLDIKYFDIEGYLDTFQTDIEHRIDK